MSASLPPLVRETPFRWRIEQRGDMRVPGIVYTSAELLGDIEGDQSLQQVVNVATLPGIVEASYAMADMHWGYGFPIGGVAATDVDDGGVVSPGGVGFDISCGVRLLTSRLPAEDAALGLGSLMDMLDREIPRGLGTGAVWTPPNRADLDDVLERGAVAVTERGFGTAEDLTHCEDGGGLPGADLAAVGDRATERGIGQVGSLGSGNHFLEIQVVDRVLDADLAQAMDLDAGLLCVMIHSGSRGLGHQICSDHVRTMTAAMERLGITVPDRQLACAPVRSPEGEAYLGAMAAAANYGRANRQLLTHATRQAVQRVFGDTAELTLLYDVSHNLAKLETHDVGGDPKLLCVHRKGATRALPPGHPDLPPALAPIGQPVLVPGSMGTASYVLAGADTAGAFWSCCHGAGRTMSRSAATKKIDGKRLAEDLESAGIAVRAQSWRGLAEEAPFAYKDIDDVVAVCTASGLARPVARLRPIGVVKA